MRGPHREKSARREMAGEATNGVTLFSSSDFGWERVRAVRQWEEMTKCIETYWDLDDSPSPECPRAGERPQRVVA